MENFFNTLPKSILVFFVISAGVAVAFLLNPPHTVCDSQEETFKENQRGTLFAQEVKKHKIPPALGRVKEACQLGNSMGSCYEYFSLLSQLSQEIGKSSNECVVQLYNVPEVKLAISDAIELMVRMAWGAKAPEIGPEKVGWMQDSDLNVFCRLKSVFIWANGEEAWDSLRLKVFQKLPAEELPVVDSSMEGSGAQARKALEIMTPLEVYERSLFSVKCDSF